MTHAETSSAHTPAPWRFQTDGAGDNTRIVSKDGKHLIASCDSEATCRLIAAAPELLDILMDIADKSGSPSDTIIRMSPSDKITDYLMDEYNRRTQV